MALSGKRVGLLVALTVVALAGLILLQVSLLRYAMTIKEQTFRNNVMTALGRVSYALAAGEAASLFVKIDSLGSGPRQARIITVTTGDSTHRVDDLEWVGSGPEVRPEFPVKVQNGIVRYRVPSPQHIALTVTGISSELDTTLVDRYHEAGDYEFTLETDRLDHGVFMWKYQSDSSTQMMRVTNLTSDTALIISPNDSSKQVLAATVVERMFAAEMIPIAERLDSINVDSLIGTTLSQSGIDMEYAYGVQMGSDDELLRAEPAGYEGPLRASDLRVRLFPQDVFAVPAYLTLHFPDHRAYIWAQIIPLVGAEVLFMLIIIACFAYTIRTILRQRRFSQLLVDFINNMTHEFKTPISTVALATEAIQRPDILEQKDKVLQFNQMIQTEIGRMRNQADKILQMATLEEGDIALSLSEVNLHDLISDAATAVSLQVEHAGGSLTCNLDATDPLVTCDKLHVANIVHNLLDNAVKYSREAPVIRVRTSHRNGDIVVRVEDEGIGVSPEEQKHVFQKYYRVPTGRRHDVKGFGLGLSYVKLMVEAHGGRLALESTPGQGTRVEFTLPRGDSA